MNGLFLSLLALISCAGCTISRTFFTTPDCDTNVSRLSKWAEHSASENGTIRVLLAHGMNNHPFGSSGGKPNLYGCGTYAGLQNKFSGTIAPKERQDLHALAVKAQFYDLIKALARELGAGQENELGEHIFNIVKSNDGLAAGYIFPRSFDSARPRRRALKFTSLTGPSSSYRPKCKLTAITTVGLRSSGLRT